jgi:hypothetical protein
MLHFHEASQALVRAAYDATSLWHLPLPVRLAIEAAKAEERCLTHTTPGNTANDFDITSVNIDGKTWPVLPPVNFANMRIIRPDDEARRPRVWG